jgi:hypothetical protein
VLLRLRQLDPKLTLTCGFRGAAAVGAIFIKLGLYRAVLKFLDDRIVYTVFVGVSLSLLVLMAVILMAGIAPLPVRHRDLLCSRWPISAAAASSCAASCPHRRAGRAVAAGITTAPAVPACS